MAFKKQYFMDSHLFEKEQYSSPQCCQLQNFITYFLQKSIIIFSKIGQVLQRNIKYYWHVLGDYYIIFRNIWLKMKGEKEISFWCHLEDLQQGGVRSHSHSRFHVSWAGFHAVPAHSAFCEIGNSGLQRTACTGAVHDPALCYRQI